MYTMQWLSAHCMTFGRAPQPSNLTRVWILLRGAVGACGRAIRAFPRRSWLRARQTLNQETQSEHIFISGALQSQAPGRRNEVRGAHMFPGNRVADG
jgi:hypothetical protein